MRMITPRRFSLTQGAVVTLLAAFLVACDDPQPTMTTPDDESAAAPSSTQAPATPQPPAIVSAPPVQAPSPTTDLDAPTPPVDPGRLTVLGPIALELPEGWRIDDTPKPLRLATLRPEQEDAQIEIILTVMAGGGPLDLANVNRWRQQVGMGPVASLDGEQIEPITAELNGYAYILLADNDQAPGSLVAALQLTPDRRIYLRMAGLSGPVREHADDFHAIVHSVRPQ